MKACSKCRRELPVNAFYVRTTGRPHAECRDCSNRRQSTPEATAWRREYEHSPARIERRRAYYRSAEVRARRLVHGAGNRARRAGLPFDLTVDDIVIPDRCPVLGIPMRFGAGQFAPSLDRLRPELGYVRGNVRVISLRANRLKSDATPEELRAILAYVEAAPHLGVYRGGL